MPRIEPSSSLGPRSSSRWGGDQQLAETVSVEIPGVAHGAAEPDVVQGLNDDGGRADAQADGGVEDLDGPVALNGAWNAHGEAIPGAAGQPDRRGAKLNLDAAVRDGEVGLPRALARLQRAIEPIHRAAGGGVRRADEQVRHAVAVEV